MDFNDLILDFENKFTRKKICTYVEGIKVIWHFCGLKEVVNFQEFITFLESAFASKISENLVLDIKNKIYLLRDNINNSFLSVCEKIELYDGKKTEKEKLFIAWASSLYPKIIDFVSNSLITYIFYNLIHKNRVINNIEVDVDEYFLYQYHDLEVDLLRFEREVLRKLKNQNNKFLSLFEEFLINIENAKNDLAKTKKILFGKVS